MVLIGLSATLLASIAVTPIVMGQDDTSDSSELVEDSSEELTDESGEETSDMSSEESTGEETDVSSEESIEETSETTSEDTTTEMSTEVSEEEVATEASLVQQGVEEALDIFRNEYPDAHIEEIDVELDREDDTDEDDEVTETETTEMEAVYQITINGFDADDNDFELEIEWVNGEIREQAFNEGLFNSDESDTMDTTDTTVVETDTTLEDTSTESMTEESVEMDTTSEEPAVDANETTDRRGLDLEALLTLDEAAEIAMAEYGEGEITNWNLTIDDPDWYEFWVDGYENPIWTIDIENTIDDDRDDEEIRIDAVSGDIINLEDIDTPESMEGSEGTESVSEESIEESSE